MSESIENIVLLEANLSNLKSLINKLRDENLEFSKDLRLKDESLLKQKNQLKVRNAKIGTFKNELSEEDISYCNSEMKKLNSYFDYQI